MTERFYVTALNPEHILEDNNYVLGRISATFRIICNMDNLQCYGVWNKESDTPMTCFVTQTTMEKYSEAMNIIEGWYPGLCIFNYSLEKIETGLPEWVKKMEAGYFEQKY